MPLLSTPAILEERLARLSTLCLALPEVARDGHGEQVWFEAPASAATPKKFAYYLHDHHGDGRVALSVRLPRGANAALVDADPARYYLPAYTAHHGWAALRLDLPTVDWEEVSGLVVDSYCLQAPRRLARLVTPATPAR